MSEHTTPSEFSISTILFLRYRCVALLWKNLLFLSPSCNHRALDRCFHISSSLTNRPVSSLFTLFNQSVLLPLMATSSASFSCFLFSFSCLRMLPKIDRLHHFNSAWHLNICSSISLHWVSWYLTCPNRFNHPMAPFILHPHLFKPPRSMVLLWHPFGEYYNGLVI